MSPADIASVLKAVGSTGFALVFITFICLTLLTTLVTLIWWVLKNMVLLEVHTDMRDNLCEQMDRLERGQQGLLAMGGGHR